jgi:hypothetical protein
MKHLKLTSDEIKELEKRGFLIRQTFSIGDLFGSFPIFFVVFGVSIFFSILLSIITIIFVDLEASYIVLFLLFLTSIPAFLLLIRTSVSYIFLGNTFYFNE